MGLYGSLPPRLQSAAASIRGLQLRSWRYGPETDRLVAEAGERENWDERRWEAFREESLALLLHRAATRVPYYRDLWSARRRAGNRASWELLANWPILEKDALRRAPQAFVADDVDPRRMFRDHTSGTTGSPLTLLFSRETVRRWYALFERRVRNWNGINRRERWAILGGQLVVPARRGAPPFWVWNAAARQLYLSSYHLSPPNIGAYFDAIRAYRVTYLLGYASSLYSLALAALESSDPAPRVRVAISNAEPFYRHQRDAISKAFGCPTRDTYGMAEIACAASECAEGTLHEWPEVGVVQVLRRDSDELASPGEAGRLVATGLMNRDMPLIRYVTGDQGGWRQKGRLCPCGRTLPQLSPVEGRSDDVLVTPDGRRVGRLDPVFKSQVRIREAQIIQETADRVRLRVVPAEGFDASDAGSLTRALQERLGERVTIVLETVDHIPRTSAGKFRAVVSLIAGQMRMPPDGGGS